MELKAKWIPVILTFFLVSTVLPYLTMAGEVSIEELSRMYGEEIVVSASKREQKISEAPSTIHVVTGAEIKRSGATTLLEALRIVPGLDVLRSTASDSQVSIRGLNTTMSNNVMALIDGRSVYHDFFDMVIWEDLPIILEEIERVEILSGPASALYGPNSFGLINIITKSPEKTEGLLLSSTYGEDNTLINSLIGGGSIGKIKYRVSGSLNNQDQFRILGTDDIGSSQFKKINLLSQYDLGDSKISLRSGISEGNIEQLDPSANRVGADDDVNRYLQVDYEKEGMLLRTFWNGHRSRWVQEGGYNYNVVFEYDTYDIEFQKSLDLTPNNIAVLGANFRYNFAEKSNVFTENLSQSILGLYLQDEMRMRDNLFLNISGRLDRHPDVDILFSPRLSLRYIPVENHTLRFSGATAFRTPSFVEAHINSPVAVPGLGTFFWQGNSGIDAESITSFEASYHNTVLENLKGELNIFVNEISDPIDDVNIAFFPGTPFPSQTTWQNRDDVDVIGGELGFNFLFTEWLTGLLNYTYLDVRAPESEESSTSSPISKVNSGLRFTAKNGISADLLFHFIDKTQWQSGDLNSYAYVNGRIGYSFPGENLEASLAVYNLFNDEHREHPNGEDLGRRVVGKLTYKF